MNVKPTVTQEPKEADERKRALHSTTDTHTHSTQNEQTALLPLPLSKCQRATRKISNIPALRYAIEIECVANSLFHATTCFVKHPVLDQNQVIIICGGCAQGEFGDAQLGAGQRARHSESRHYLLQHATACASAGR